MMRIYQKAYALFCPLFLLLCRKDLRGRWKHYSPSWYVGIASTRFDLLDLESAGDFANTKSQSKYSYRFGCAIVKFLASEYEKTFNFNGTFHLVNSALFLQAAQRMKL